MKRIITAALILSICLCLTACDSSNYSKAVKLKESSSFAEALELFEDIEDYKDSAEQASICESMISVIEKYNSAASSAKKKNSELDNAVSDAEALLSESPLALDKSLSPALETAVSDTKAAKISIPEMPLDEKEIIAVTKQIDSIDYSEVLKNLADKKVALEKSIKQYELVKAPTEAYVIECLKKVSNVVDISAVTEDNDPNGKLNKAGGYIAQVYFSSDLIDQNEIYGTTIIDKGTDCGGSIEVYANADDAIKRNDYLSAFDGSAFSSGSHTVIGTVVVRTSDELTATQQKTLENNIITALTALE